MAAIEIQCPQCTKPISADTEFINLVIECPHCRKKFQLVKEVFEPKKTSPLFRFHSRVSYNTEDPLRKVKIGIRIALAVIAMIGIAIGCYYYFRTTPESLKGNQFYAMTKRRQNRDGAPGMCEIAKHDFFSRSTNFSDFFYRDANFSDIYLESKGNETYVGTVTFTRNRFGKKELSRPIEVVNSGAFTHYHFRFDYSDHPEYMKEDADLIFAVATQINKKLQEWDFVSATVSGSILTCKISKNGTEKEVKLQVEQVYNPEDKINRLWVKVLTKL